MTNIQDTLAQRQVTHGDFRLNALASQQLKEIIKCNTIKILSRAHREALDLICGKIARIVTGDPNHADSWHDIAGYATLIENIILKEQE